MKYLPCNNCDFVIVDDEDYDRLSVYSWQFGGTGRGRVNRTVRINRRKVKAISLASDIMNRHGVLFDHIDRNPLNNQKCNLREATRSQNQMNKDKVANCSSKYKGVSFRKETKMWRALIRINGKLISLGQFKTEIEAAKVYNAKAVELFKEFACLNEFPSGENSME